MANNDIVYIVQCIAEADETWLVEHHEFILSKDNFDRVKRFAASIQEGDALPKPASLNDNPDYLYVQSQIDYWMDRMREIYLTPHYNKKQFEEAKSRHRWWLDQEFKMQCAWHGWGFD